MAREKWGHLGVKVVLTLEGVLEDGEVDVVSSKLSILQVPDSTQLSPVYAFKMNNRSSSP